MAELRAAREPAVRTAAIAGLTAGEPAARMQAIVEGRQMAVATPRPQDSPSRRSLQTAACCRPHRRSSPLRSAAILSRRSSRRSDPRSPRRRTGTLSVPAIVSAAPAWVTGPKRLLSTDDRGRSQLPGQFSRRRVDAANCSPDAHHREQHPRARCEYHLRAVLPVDDQHLA